MFLILGLNSPFKILPLLASLASCSFLLRSNFHSCGTGRCCVRFAVINPCERGHDGDLLELETLLIRRC